MKVIARKRLFKEYKKRSFLPIDEKKEFLLNFIQFSSNLQSTEFWINSFFFKKRNSGRKSWCKSHCFISGRGRSVYKHFRLTRNMVRKLAHRGQIYGLTKASWLYFSVWTILPFK